MGDGWDPLPFTTPPPTVKTGVTLGEAPGLTGVASDQEGLPDDPGSHHVAGLTPSRAPPGDAPEHAEGPGTLQDEKGLPASVCDHPGVSRGNLGWL
jgi:hypothetical protein